MSNSDFDNILETVLYCDDIDKVRKWTIAIYYFGLLILFHKIKWHYMSKLLLGFDNILHEVLGYEVFGQVRT